MFCDPLESLCRSYRDQNLTIYTLPLYSPGMLVTVCVTVTSTGKKKERKKNDQNQNLRSSSGASQITGPTRGPQASP